MFVNLKIWFGILSIVLMIVLIILWTKDIRRLEEENRQLQLYIVSMEDFYKEIKDKIEETRKYRHDLGKHIQTMEQLLNTYHGGSFFQESVKKMKNEFSRMKEQQYSNHELIDIICQIKKKECEDREIQFITEIGDIFSLPVSEMDMIGLLQNLLDNGMEACERIVEKNGKEMILTINQRNSGLEITLKNTCDLKIPVNFQTRKKRKEEHGFGTKIIQGIVNKAHGELRYSSGNGWVNAYVFLPFQMQPRNNEKLHI